MAFCGSFLGFCGARPQPLPVYSAAAAAASASPSTYPSLPLRRRTTTCCTNRALPPMPPLNPRDPSLSRPTSLVASSPEPPTARPASSDPDTPPYLDLFQNPQLRATHAEVGRTLSPSERKPRRPPPDLPSQFLHDRIVYIGMPLVPIVTKLLIAELFHLQSLDPEETIYLYINSTGTTRDDGEPVALESEGFAIYDVLMSLTNEIKTLNLGIAMGHACLLLAAGKKGGRFMLPHATAVIQQPRIPSSGLMPASSVAGRAKEAIHNRDALVKLLARHTGNSVEEVSREMKGTYYMNALKAQEFGVIDKILRYGPEKSMPDVAAAEEWDK